MTPLRICHLITDLDTGGAERTLVNLVTRMDRTLVQSDVVTLVEPGPMARPLMEAGIPVTGLGMQRGRPSLAALARLLGHLRATKPAIVQTWLYHADLIGTIATAIVRPRRLLWNIRCTDITQASNERRIRWVVRLLAMLSRRPDALVVNSQRGQSDHAMIGYNPKRWVNIPNGVDLERFRPRQEAQAALRKKLSLYPDVPTIGLVARYHPMKDVETFLRAASLFRKARADTQFVLCGEGFTPDNGNLMATIGNLGLDSHLILLGQRSDVELVYPTLDILTLCSIYGEGFSNALCEAMACGVPCVATDIGDSVEIIGDCGMIVPMRDPQSLAEAWRSLIERGPVTIGKFAHSRVAARYSIDHMCLQYQSLYRSLICNTGAT